MDAITYTSAGANLARTMDCVCEDHEPFVERANPLNRPLRTRTAGGVGAPASSRCLPELGARCSAHQELPRDNRLCEEANGE